MDKQPMSDKKKVAIIGTNGLPGRYGGWDQLMNHLTVNLRNVFSFVVYTSSHDAQDGLKTYNGAVLKIIKLKANGIQSIPYDIVSMIHSVYKKYDVLLILGTSGCIFLPVIKLFNNKVVLNPDGAEWKRGKWNKPTKWFLRLSEKLGVKYADVVVSDNKVIQDYIYSEYNVKAELIEYGGDNTQLVPMSKETEEKYGIESGKYAFKVCRIEPENNIDMILNAFAGKELKLVLIGNWNFSEYGKNLRSKFSKYANLLLLDPNYDQTQLDEIRGNCSIYVHGHSVGGTNPSLVEAMNLGLCCVVFNVDYNIETTENSAIYFKSEEELSNVIAQYDNNEIDLQPYREKMRLIAKRRYLWEIITDKYSKVMD
jgi:glycosyltransferase involved in cell wall biosynthesis